MTLENNKASMTAMVSAFGRAYHSLYEKPKIFDDYLARQMLTDEEFTNISINMANGIHFFNPEEAHLYTNQDSALKWIVQTQLAPTPLARSRYTEDTLEKTMNAGVTQYIILGAGYDTFAFRKQEWLKHLSVYELDHPATQASKLDRIERLGWPVNPALHFVPVNFSKDDFTKALLESSYSPNKLSFFSWLGVTYYLTKEEILKTLSDITHLAKKGSTIVFDYADSDILNPTKTSKRVQRMVLLAQASGEPMKTGFQLYELKLELEKMGLKVIEHLTPADIEEKYFRGRSDNYHAFENTCYISVEMQ